LLNFSISQHLGGPGQTASLILAQKKIEWKLKKVASRTEQSTTFKVFFIGLLLYLVSCRLFNSCAGFPVAFRHSLCQNPLSRSLSNCLAVRHMFDGCDACCIQECF